MPSLTRLPAGYKNEVRKIKAELKQYIDMLNRTNMTSYQKIEHIRSKYQNYINFGTYTIGDETMIDFDIGILAVELIVSNTTGKCRLFNSCTVFIPGTDDFVDNYKW